MKETMSLKNLMLFIEKGISPNITGVLSRKIRVQPTNDVVEYIDSRDDMCWVVVGYDKNNNPIYDKYISVNIENGDRQ